MSKTQICDVVVKCFKKFDKDIVMKSFACCGLTYDAQPSDITCLKPGQAYTWQALSLDKKPINSLAINLSR